MKIAFLIGRIIVGMFYLYNASNHVIQLNMMAAYAGSKGVPAPQLAVLAAGALLLVGGLSLITGYQPFIGVIAIVLFFLPVTFMMHNFWAASEPMEKMSQLVNFTKNMALMGSALMFLAIPRPWPFSLGK